MLLYGQAIDIILNRITPLPPVLVDLDQSLGKVLAEKTIARWDSPGSNTSAMDGFTFASAMVEVSKPITVIEFLPAGKKISAPVVNGCVRIMTGAPLPDNCDTVVMIEDVEIDGERIRLRKPPQPGQNVRRRGEEFHAGEILLEPGVVLHSGEIGLLATAGIEQVMVHPTPRVALLVTGDELVELGQTPVDGKIVNSNLYLIRARLQEDGYPVIELGTIGDQPDLLARELERGFTADLVLTTGGVSIGDHDFIRNICDQLTMDVHFWKLAIKPGKPALFATRNGTPFFGLPGNPAASAATFEILVRPAIRRLAGYKNPCPVRVLANLGYPVANRGKREQFLWGKISANDTGLIFTPTNRQSSGQTRSLEGFNALLPIPPEKEWPLGSEVHPLLLRMPY